MAETGMPTTRTSSLFPPGGVPAPPEGSPSSLSLSAATSGLDRIAEDPTMTPSSSAGLVPTTNKSPYPRRQRLMPRSPTTGPESVDELSSISASPAESGSEDEDDDLGSGAAAPRGVGRSRSKANKSSVGTKNSRMSMLDFLSGEPPRGWNGDEPRSDLENDNNQRTPRAASTASFGQASSVGRDPHLSSPMPPCRKAGPPAPIDTNVIANLTNGKRTSMFVPRAAVAETGPILPSSTRSASAGSGLHAPSDSSTVVPRSADAVRPTSMLFSRDATPPAAVAASDSPGEMTAFEFLYSNQEPEEDAGTKEPSSVGAGFSKGKARASNDASNKGKRSSVGDRSKRVEVRVTPRTDSITMFGSTQTSSNYSLSGTVVLKINPAQAQGHGKEEPFSDDGNHGLQEQTAAATPASATARKADPKSDALAMEQDIVEMMTGRHKSASSKRPARSGASSPMLPPIVRDQSDSWDPEVLLRAPEASLRRTSVSMEPSRSGQSSRQSHHTDHEGTADDALKITSLKVTFSGFALYLDSSGRFSALRLAKVTQELLPESATLLLSASRDGESSEGGVDPAKDGLREGVEYEIEFDLSVPGWLPGTFHSRFGNTFYCLDAQACYSDQPADQEIPTVTISRSKSMLAPRVPGMSSSSGSEAVSLGVEDERSRSSQRGLQPGTGSDGASSSTRRRSSRSSPNKRSSTTPAAAGDASAEPSRNKGSWLSKRAKQLQIRARTTVTALPSPSSAVTPTTMKDVSMPPEVPAPDGRSSHTDGTDGRRSARALEWARQWKQRQELVQRDQQGASKISSSDPLAIVIRRCRDVVPVPVARMAVIGPEGLPDAAMQDPPPMPGVSRVNSHSSRSVDDPLPAVPCEVPAAAVIDDTVPATPSTSAAEGSADAQIDQGPPEPLRHIVPEPLPSALDVSTDPDKRAAQLAAPLAASLAPPAAPQRGSSNAANGTSHVSSRSGGIRQGRGAGRSSASGGGASEGSGTVPMRHFLHRPVLHPPADCPVENPDGQGLPFSLTLSIPSHAQIDGPTSDMLTFGVQIEVGKTHAWNQVREQGGLRLRDMQLVCVQTERHTSAPSRTFCHSYPLPPNPKVEPIELPMLGDPYRGLQGRSFTSTDVRMRAGYDINLVRHHLELVKEGQAPDPVENNVERIRTCVVGPPPSQADKKRAAEGAKGSDGLANGKGSRKGKEKERASELKEREREREMKRDKEREAKERQKEGEREQKEKEKREKKEKRKTMPSLASSSASGHGPPSSSGPNPSSIPTVYGTTVDQAVVPSLRHSSAAASPTNLAAPSSSITSGRVPSPAPEDAPRRSESAIAGPSSSLPAADALGGEVPASQDGHGKNKKPSRGRRAYESAIRGLSSFATAVMDISLVDYEGMDGTMDGGTGGADGSNQAANMDGDDDPQFKGPRATYSFAGHDSHGVDLTRGRVRMTVNLPLVTHSASIAKRDGTAQLAADFDSPYARVRHKLKVKLGFGFGSRPLGGEGEWGQALILCVPVRFTEAAPVEVREQFAPLPITQVTASSAAASGPPVAIVPPPTTTAAPGSAEIVTSAGGAAMPILPSYNQLFREDGSRLADEGEDLPQYPGPKGPSAFSTSAATPASPARNRLGLPKRGSVTAPSPRQDQTGTFSHQNNTVGESSTSVAQGPTNGAEDQQPSSDSGETELLVANTISPSRVVDEAVLMHHASQDDLDAARREQALELREMNEESASGAQRMQSSEDEDDDEEEEEEDDDGTEEEGRRMQQPPSEPQSRFDEVIDLDAGRILVRDLEDDTEGNDFRIVSEHASGAGSSTAAAPIESGGDEDVSSIRGSSPLPAVHASTRVTRGSPDIDNWASANED